jgi:hypothetical protein
VRLAKLGAISQERGAATTIYLASSPDVADVSGAYFYKSVRETPSREAQNDDVAMRLWEESERIAQL